MEQDCVGMLWNPFAVSYGPPSIVPRVKLCWNSAIRRSSRYRPCTQSRWTFFCRFTWMNITFRFVCTKYQYRLVQEIARRPTDTDDKAVQKSSKKSSNNTSCPNYHFNSPADQVYSVCFAGFTVSPFIRIALICTRASRSWFTLSNVCCWNWATRWLFAYQLIYAK